VKTAPKKEVEAMRKGTVQVNDLADRLAQAFPKQTRIEQQVIEELLRQFIITGKPVPPAAIAAALDLPSRQVEEMLASWAGWGNAHLDNEHRVIAAWGLGLYETAHHFITNGHTLYTWCALDTFYLADLLGATARVESVCHITKEKVSFTKNCI
jgi:alkylmercury lyase